jgi:hypothetical protein
VVACEEIRTILWRVVRAAAKKYTSSLILLTLA